MIMQNILNLVNCKRLCKVHCGMDSSKSDCVLMIMQRTLQLDNTNEIVNVFQSDMMNMNQMITNIMKLTDYIQGVAPRMQVFTKKSK